MKWILKEEKQLIWIQSTGRTKQIQSWKYRLLTTSYLTGGWKYHIHNYRSTWNMEFYLLMPFCFSGFMNIVIGRLNLMLLGLNYKQNDTRCKKKMKSFKDILIRINNSLLFYISTCRNGAHLSSSIFLIYFRPFNITAKNCWFITRSGSYILIL